MTLYPFLLNYLRRIKKMTKEKIIEFANDFYKNHGKILINELDGEHENKQDVFINRVELIIYEEIKSRNPSFRLERLVEAQKMAIWKAMMEQAIYMLLNYDANLISGLDPIDGKLIELKEIRAREISPLASKILRNAGLFYGGISPAVYSNEPFVSFWS